MHVIYRSCIPFWTSAVSSTSSVSYVASSRVPSAIAPVPKLISSDVDSGLSKENRVTCGYYIVRTHAPRLPLSSRPKVPHPLIRKMPLESAVSLNLSKVERLETSPHSNSLPAANLALPHSKTRRM